MELKRTEKGRKRRMQNLESGSGPGLDPSLVVVRVLVVVWSSPGLGVVTSGSGFVLELVFAEVKLKCLLCKERNWNTVF